MSILLVVRDVKIKAAEEAGDETMKQSWELVLISLFSGILVCSFGDARKSR